MTKERQSLGEFIEETVDQTTTAVEEIHKTVANLPLKLMEESELLRQPAREVRRLQERAIAAIYQAVRDLNRRVARLVADVIDGQARRRAQTRKAAA